jgi:hypothetical protein
MEVKIKSLKAALLFAVVALTLVGVPFIKSLQAQPTSDVIWISGMADVDWHNENEPYYVVVNDGTEYTSTGGWDRDPYLYNTPFIVAKNTHIRIQMGIFNLREQVYWRGVRRLDEGWWKENGNKRGYYYGSKSTGSTPQGPCTTWTKSWTSNGISEEITLKRLVYWPPTLVTVGSSQFLAYIVEYNILYSQSGAPQLVGRLGFAIILHFTCEIGSPEQSLDAILAAMNIVYSQILPAYQGILDPRLTFKLSYTFDDSMKHWPNTPQMYTFLIGWDGANAGDFQNAGIDYEDTRYSPLTTGLPWQPSGSAAIFAMPFKALHTRKTLEMDLIDVGPTGAECQRVTITFEENPPFGTGGGASCKGFATCVY